jgi:NAD(P)-dependent dehydrogenase (short-subunit alcohol dehydrogenase family)
MSGDTLGVTGRRTSIVEHLLRLVPDDRVVSIGRRPDDDVRIDLARPFDVGQFPSDLDRYVLAAGVMYPRRLADQSFDETATSLAVNLTSVVRVCEHLLDANPRARICLIGSESFRGSYDTTYFVAKAGLNAYVERRRLSHPGQQLVIVSPTIIMDSGMTERRDDLDQVADRAQASPKHRFLYAAEVARLVRFVLWEDDGMLTNTVVSMNGGVFA